MPNHFIKFKEIFRSQGIKFQSIIIFALAAFNSIGQEIESSENWSQQKKQNFYNEVLGTFEVSGKNLRNISVDFNMIQQIDSQRREHEDYIWKISEELEIKIYSMDKISSDEFVKQNKIIFKD